MRGILRKGVSLLLGAASLWLVNAPAQEFGARDDLWDISQGSVVTATSGLISSESQPGMFGSSDFFASTIFADDRPNGFVHFIEWRTAAPVTVKRVRLFGGGDGPDFNHAREFERFVLKAK